MTIASACPFVWWSILLGKCEEYTCEHVKKLDMLIIYYWVTIFPHISRPAQTNSNLRNYCVWTYHHEVELHWENILKPFYPLHIVGCILITTFHCWLLTDVLWSNVYLRSGLLKPRPQLYSQFQNQTFGGAGFLWTSSLGQSWHNIYMYLIFCSIFAFVISRSTSEPVLLSISSEWYF